MKKPTKENDKRFSGMGSKDHEKQMAKYLLDLSRRHGVAPVFNDFLSMTICSYHAVNIQSRLTEQDAENEKRYLDIVKKYNAKELELFAKALAEAQLNVYENPYSDVFGDFFMDHLSNDRQGQFFTPSTLSDLLTRLNGEPNTIHGKSVCDPTCGSARTLLSFAKANPDNYFYGVDVSKSCAMMAAINFFLNGLRGEVAWMNTLSMEWFGSWQINSSSLGIVPIEKEQSFIWSKPPEKNVDTTKVGQLILF